MFGTSLAGGDRALNIVSAADVGFEGVLFTGVADLRPQLVDRGVDIAG
ncbi:MAG: hypothetical protein GY720_06310 [bacterium]|nr:hypothetical protein [bacterium]